jgi:excisionase family DNA binding protein
MIAATDDDLVLTTGEAARLLGSSRQHVVDLIDRGDLPATTSGTHRRVLRRDIEALGSRTQRMTRDQRRSRRLSIAVAGKLVADPEAGLTLAESNIDKLRKKHARGQAAYWLDRWEKLIAGPLDGVLDALTSTSPVSRELRQNAPFAGLLTDEEREQILTAFIRAVR